MGSLPVLLLTNCNYRNINYIFIYFNGKSMGEECGKAFFVLPSIYLPILQLFHKHPRKLLKIPNVECAKSG